MKKYLLGVDNGGTYIKAAIFDEHGTQLGICRQYNRIHKPAPGRSEYNQEELWRSNCSCIRGVLHSTGIHPGEIACIAVAGQGCGFYAIDEHGNSVRNAISSSDGRAFHQLEKWKQDGTSRSVYPYIYRDSSAGHLNAILAWMKENEPESYNRIYRLFSMKDFLVYRLTGEIISGYGCMSASGLMDIRTKAFSPKLAEAFGISEMADRFGTLRWDMELCGTVTEEASFMCGCEAGTPVASGSHDVVASALAMGITDSKLCFMITGTHGINGYISPVPVLNGTIKYNELFAFPGSFLIEEGYPSSSATLEWVISVLFADTDRTSSEIYHEVNEEVAQVTPQECDLVFMPFLRGHRDNAQASGTWIGLRPEHTRSHMLRAVYEGVVFSHMLQMEHLFANRERPERIRMAGGATNSRVWVQIFADAFGIPIEVVPNEEMGAKGAAIVAAAAVNMYQNIDCAVKAMTKQGETVLPDKENANIYARKFVHFRNLVQTLDEEEQETENTFDGCTAYKEG